MSTLAQKSTIAALSTAEGKGAIGIIRLSGSNAFSIAESFFVSKKKIAEQKSHTIHFGKIIDNEKIIDEVVVSIFKNPHSFTGEDVIEIACHGSPYILKTVLELCLKAGAVLAQPGEFTMRAFMNGKLDLSQAEAVADIIASENESQHRIALQQMRGGYSEKIKLIRQELIDFAALMELELDFSEEDVEFADRKKFLSLVSHSLQTISELKNSFQLGNVIKNGIPVAIVGKPNAGKSTLLNRLLNEEKAIVSEIAGTTRDFIEDTLQYNGVTYRFIDTAGIRDTEDTLESKGIERSFEKIKLAEVILYLAEATQDYKETIRQYEEMKFDKKQHVIIVLTKSDEAENLCNVYDIEEAIATLTKRPTIEISAKQNRNIDKLLSLIEQKIQSSYTQTDIIVSNARHAEAFEKAHQSLQEVKNGLEQGLSGELVAIDLRTAHQHLSSITGQITNEDVLSSVFSRFCIGK